MSDIADLIDRAAQDPEFLSAIVPADQLNAVLGIADTREIAETLRARIAHAHNGKK